MLDKNHIVDIPVGAIVKSDRRVLWTIRKVYLKEKQYNQDSRRLIGKTVEASRIKMYPNDNFIELFPDQYSSAVGRRPLPSSQSVGMYLAVKTIVERLPLYTLLSDVFGKHDADQIVDYAMYQIIYSTGVAQHYEACMEGKALFSEKLRCDSFLSDFFRGSVDADRSSQFLDEWAPAIIKHKKMKKVYLNVDGTNLDDEAEGVTLKEKGHDKSGEDTTVVGVMYVVSPDGTGVFYHQYRGSVIDSTAVKYVYMFFKNLPVRIAGFCADRGFCTKAGTDHLREMGCGFVLMMTSKPEGFTAAKDVLRDSIRNNMDKWIEGTELFGDRTNLRMFKGDEADSYLHVFYDPARGGAGIKMLLRKVNNAAKRARNAIRKKKPVSIPPELQEYVHLRKGKGPRTVVIEYGSIQDAINDKGFHVMATSEDMETMEAWKVYHSRDSSEKQYDIMKSETGLDAYRSGSDEGIGGRQFVAFIAGIIRNELLVASRSLIEKTGRTDFYSVPAMIKELLAIRIKRLPGNEYALVMDLSERDNTMLKELGITSDMLDECVATQNLRLKGRNR